MTILAVDDEIGALTALKQKIEATVPDAQLVTFTSPEDALQYANESPCDIAFLDIDMPRINGIDLAKILKMKNSKINIIFITAYDQYGVDAFALYASGYLLKPICSEDIKKELENLRYPVLEKRLQDTEFERSEITADKKEAKQWFRQFMIDTKKRAVYRVDNQEAGDLVSLSPIEYSILLTMTEHRDEVILYNQLYKSVWNQDDIGDVRTLMVHVSNLRKKIDLNHTDMIRSIRGFGYMFQDT